MAVEHLGEMNPCCPVGFTNIHNIYTSASVTHLSCIFVSYSLMLFCACYFSVETNSNINSHT